MADSITKVATDFPDHDIDPREKDEAWILQLVKACWEHSRLYCGDVLWHGRETIAELRTFMHGWQSVENSKRQIVPEDQLDSSWVNIDWSRRPLMTTYIEKMVAKILKRDFNIVCNAINERADVEQDDFYNKLRVKLLMRENLAKTNPALLEMPSLRLNESEPQTIEQLNAYMQYGYKHAMSMFGEMSVEMAFNEWDIQEERRKVVTDLVGIGAGTYKDEINTNGRSKFRYVRPENLVSSFCNQPDLSDATHMGEVIPKTMGEIARYFTKAEMELIKKQAAGQWGNPAIIDPLWNTSWQTFKVMVWDAEMFSYNQTKNEMAVDKYGNLKVSKLKYDTDIEARKAKKAKNGQAPEYVRDVDEVIYKTCWIIGTDFQYNAGLATNQKRSLGDPRRTKLSYHFQAWNFDYMRFEGMAIRLRPLQEEYQTVQYKLQNFRNKWIPYVLEIDIAAIEKAAFKGRGGTNMTPMQILDFMFQQHILALRKDNAGEGSNPNYRAVDIHLTKMADEFQVLFSDLQRINEGMQLLTGFNAVTAGTNMDPRMLQDGYAASMAGTDDSLFQIMGADKRLLVRLAQGILQRQQISVKMGTIKGYVNIIGRAGVKLISLNPDISLYDYGIFAEDKPDAAKREAFLQKLEINLANGLILPQDYIMIENCRNFKQAEIELAFRIDKRKNENQQNQLQVQQATVQGQAQNQQQAAMIADGAADRQLDRDIKKINLEKQWDYIIQQTKTEGSSNDTEIHAKSKILAQQLIEDTKRMGLAQQSTQPSK